MTVTVGCQEPRVKTFSPFVWSAGDDCAFLAHSYGLTLDKWQQGWVTDCLGETSAGRLAAGTCGIAVARQNGKNGGVEAVQLYKMVVQGRKILHTAHEMKTARKHFLRMLSFFDNQAKYPELYALVNEVNPETGERGYVRQTNGQEAIVLNTGGSIEFVARSRGSGRGYTVDDLFFDEAQELTDEQLEALLPTISAAPSGDPQQYYLGTPPPERSPGLVFPRVRAAGVSGKAKRFVWWEWSIPDDANISEAVKRWRENAYATNPALGVRLNIQTVRDELSSMSAEGFARERLGWWKPQAAEGDRLISDEQWENAGRGTAPSGSRCLGIAFSADGERQGVSGAVRHGEGPAWDVHTELVGSHTGSTEAGLGSLVEWLAGDRIEGARWRSYAEIVISGSSHAQVLFERLVKAGVPPQVLRLASSPEYFTSCATFLDGVVSGWLTHSAVEGQKVLDASVAACGKRIRSRDGAWGWHPTVPDGDEVPLESASLAVWSARNTKRVAVGDVGSSGSGRRAGRRTAGRR